MAHVAYRYILRSRAGVDYTHPNGRLMAWPSYASALRGRAMLDCTAHIIQQEQSYEQAERTGTSYRETISRVSAVS
jgi:hypothetical protein